VKKIMKKMKVHKYFLAVFLALFFIAGRPLEFGNESNFFHGYVIPQPVIKVGLVIGLKQATISSSSGMKIYEIGKEYRLLAEDVEEVIIRVDREKLTEKFVLLVAQTRDRQEAELLAADLSQKLIGQVVLEEKSDPGGMLYLVKYGEFLTRTQALESIRQLENLGYQDIWIIRETITLPELSNIWLQINHKLFVMNQETDLYFIPSFAQSFLSLNGRSYRGIFVLKNTSRGLSLINILNLEDYLKGVVPLEMSPNIYNSLEALKAQAVAARTYALKNLGRNRHLGFDLTDTQSSQVYGGMSAEQTLSNRAVEETTGEVIVYRGELIDALYTSTCGGMTEDSENVFSGKPVPYLKSTSCTYEQQPEWQIVTTRKYPAVFLGSRDILVEVMPLLASGLISDQDEDFNRPVSGAEIESSLRRVNERKMQNNPARLDYFNSLQEVNFVNLARGLVDFFGWQEKTDLLILPAEVNFVLKENPANRQLKENERRELAYLLQSGIYPNYLKEENFFRPVTRAEFAYILKKSVAWLNDIYHQGQVLGKKENQLEVLENKERRQLILPDNVFLIRKLEEGSFPASKLTLLGGEQVRWIELDGKLSLIEVIYPFNTNVMDRSSRYNRWEVRVAREQLQQSIKRAFPQIGNLVNLKVLHRGKSGRVAELQIIGDQGNVTVQGLRIKWILNLRDMLFSIDREYDPQGQLSHFVFSGRGWGHGVGLCQVGSYGMALSGADYRKIISHYYKNVKIEKIH